MKLDLFYVPSVEYSHKFIDILEDVYIKLKDRIVFEPNIVTFTSKSEEFISHNCVSNGNYCAFEPSHETSITGRDVVLEGIRQKCIYKANTAAYFSYMQAFHKSCMHSFKEDCSKKAMRSASVDSSQIEQCVNQSFRGTNKILFNNDNDILADDKEKLKKLSHASFPNMYINGNLYKGSLEHFDILLSLCSALHDETQECRNLDIVPYFEIPLANLIMGHLLVLLVGVIIMAFICRRIAKRQYLRELNKAVDKFVTEYTAIGEESKLN